MKPVFAKILELCALRDVTIKQICDDTGLSLNYIYSLKNTKSPSIANLGVLADYFDVTLDFLAGREKKMDSYDKGFIDGMRHAEKQVTNAIHKYERKMEKQ